jgi:hypothetical protein
VRCDARCRRFELENACSREPAAKIAHLAQPQTHRTLRSHVLPMNHDVRESSISAKGSRPWPICPGLDVSSFAGVTVAVNGARCQQRHRHDRCELSSNPRLLLEKGSAPLEKPRLISSARRPIVRRHHWRCIDTSRSVT